jgi:lysophospholipase L1-like esterase
MQTLLLLGDSLIEYGEWDDLLPEYLTVNRGVSGETVGELSTRLGWEVERVAEPDHIFIMSGTNNLLMGDQSFPAVFTTMLPRLKQLESKADITVVSLAPMSLPWIPATTLESVNSTLKEAACEAGCLFLELASLFHLHCRPVGNPCFLPDGVHFSPHGYRVLATAVREHLETLS